MLYLKILKGQILKVILVVEFRVYELHGYLFCNIHCDLHGEVILQGEEID